MSTKSQLEHQGTVQARPLAELAAEIGQSRISGSVRMSVDDKKCIVYFREGRIVFAVSNARSSRIFDILLRQNRLTRDDLLKIPNFSNDFECASFLVQSGFMTKADRNRLFSDQVTAIIVDLLSWMNGEWQFTSLARIRDGLDFEIDAAKSLTDYARCLPAATVMARFRSLDEEFVISSSGSDVVLKPDEATILETISDEPQSLATLMTASPLDDTRTLTSIYILWMAGRIIRRKWRSAFSDYNVAAIRGAKLDLKREAISPSIHTTEAPAPDAATGTPDAPDLIVEPILVEDYLARVEAAETFYDVLGVEHDVELAAIKQAYFGLAKRFHPDHFYKEGGDLFKRVQNAFTQLASAHETLRTAESREIYDYKARKELAERAKSPGGDFDEESRRRRQAGDEFERGFNLLMEGKVEPSLPFLARAAHFDTQNPRYRAYYGKALSADNKQRHKAEAEMQAAVKLDASNPTYRIMLAEFFIHVNLKKRAEGELNRLLSIFPDNLEAQNLLTSIK